ALCGIRHRYHAVGGPNGGFSDVILSCDCCVATVNEQAQHGSHQTGPAPCKREALLRPTRQVLRRADFSTAAAVQARKWGVGGWVHNQGVEGGGGRRGRIRGRPSARIQGDGEGEYLGQKAAPKTHRNLRVRGLSILPESAGGNQHRGYRRHLLSLPPGRADVPPEGEKHGDHRLPLHGGPQHEDLYA
ncbi:unnamed protein product, partial [Ectocarpus sp. 13 AM-2016]